MILPASQTTEQTAYDIVGKYNQNKVNGFDENFLKSIVDILDLKNAENVLDAMGGDGNFISSMLDYCLEKNVEAPAMTLLELSSVQTELARKSINSSSVSIVNGDVLFMKDLQSGETLPENLFDRVVIKSGNHEIPADKQHQLYRNIFRMLKPGGSFINIGFLFNDTQEREEFSRITKVKDRLVGAMDAVANRYFLMKKEFYDILEATGFQQVECRKDFEYIIRSEIFSKEYFSTFSAVEFDKAIADIQREQHCSTMLKQHQRILFDGEHSIMHLPGEVTFSIKPNIT